VSAERVRLARPAISAKLRAAMRIFLRNHDVHARVLAYDPTSGAAEELPRDHLPSTSRERVGFYVNAGDHVVGVYASPDGPMVFHDADRYRLAESAVSLRSDDRHGDFSLSQGDVVRFEVHYPRTSGRSYDNWSSDEELIDFYQWLARASSRLHFYKHFTKAW
jgi:hypothetical protein